MSGASTPEPPMLSEHEKALAAAAFRSGWTAACLTIADALGRAGAPAEAVAMIRGMGATPQRVVVEDRRSLSREQLGRLEVVSMETVSTKKGAQS